MKVLDYIQPILISIGSFIILLVVRFVILKLIQKAVNKTQTQIGELIFRSIRLPSVLWAVILSVDFYLHFSSLPQKIENIGNKLINAIFIISFTIFVANLTVSLIRYLFETRKLPTAGTTLTFVIIQTVIYITGLLILLSYIGVPIAPLITTFGIGGLAIGLALKDTLANIFSGIYIMLEKRIEVGDFIEIDEKRKGTVTDINWRTTIITTMSNDLIVIPNEKLSQSVILNYAKPTQQVRASIEIPISYDTDVNRFETVVMEEIHKFSEETDLIVMEPPPVLRLDPGFYKDALVYTLLFQCGSYKDVVYLKSEIRKRLLKRFKKEGIQIPYSNPQFYGKEN